MRSARTYLVVLLLLGFLFVTFSPGLKADEWDKKTTVTFSGPVDVSGHRLEAGTYVFKLADTADRHVVQVFSPDEKHIYATILAMPDWRVTPTDKTTIKFSERAGDVATTERELPEAGIPVKEWFYPGDNFGQEFRVKPAPIVAEAMATPVPTTTEATPPPPAPEEKAEEKPEAPPAEPAAVAPAPQVEAPAAQTQPAEPAPEKPAETPEELPQTASPLPLIGLLGVMSMGVGISLREILKRTA